jgi:phosphoglycerate dehydrogenase-like enzyme
MKLGGLRRILYLKSSRRGLLRLSHFPFEQLDYVIMTPHIPGATSGTAARRASIVGANIDRLAAGEPIVNLVVSLSRGR